MTGMTGASRPAAWLALAAALVLALATACTTSKPPVPHHSPTTAPTYPATISPPVPRGTLRVTGVLRDGMPVRAAGLSWLPPRVLRGDKLLSFGVGYAWQACTAPSGGQGSHCATAADATATPFAAQRYLAGHDDTGKYLKVTVTATEVVETNAYAVHPASFAFSVFRTSRRSMN